MHGFENFIVDVFVTFVSRRYGSILFPVGQASWPLLLSGQFVVALIQPFFLNIVSKMAGEWFPEKEREIATVLASLAQIIGNAAGQVVPSVMLNCNQTVSPCPVDQIIGMDWLLLAQAAATSAIAVRVECRNNRTSYRLCSRVKSKVHVSKFSLNASIYEMQHVCVLF